ncbi:hypothetical protein BT69DRAFT_1337077 [Atractiella rhizophila]|nr:hypothetical protein BT69DRAFT_1337077 [Atractiella rhizophila]
MLADWQDAPMMSPTLYARSDRSQLKTRKAISHRTSDPRTHFYIYNTHAIRNSAVVEQFIPPVPDFDRPSIIRLGIQQRWELKAATARCKEQAALSLSMLQQHRVLQPNFEVHSLSDQQIRNFLQHIGQNVYLNIKLRVFVSKNMEGG